MIMHEVSIACMVSQKIFKVNSLLVIRLFQIKIQSSKLFQLLEIPLYADSNHGGRLCLYVFEG